MNEPTTHQSEVTATLPMVRCPHCRRGLTVEDPTIDEINCPSCGKHFNLLREATPMVPTRVGRFEIKESLGMGSFGAVFRAQDTNLGRDVAIKIPRRREIEAPEILEVMHEARIAATLRHPNIVTVHEVGRDGEWVYIVSDLIRGLPLNQWVEKTPLSIRQQVELCRTLTLALAHAHDSGIVHRDLKPANILIDQNDQPHLTDFSLAKRDLDVTVTMDGQILGTPAYMSPEQAQGNAHRCDARSDIYTLGVVLFELLTGELPFRGNLNVLTQKVIHEQPPSPRQLNSDVSVDLATICLKCLRKDPRQRYQSARELADDLQNWLDGKPVNARPLGLPERLWRWCVQHPIESGFACALVLTLLLITAASVAVSDQRRRGLEDMLDPIRSATDSLLREQMNPVVADAARRLESAMQNGAPQSSLALTEFLKNEFGNVALRQRLADREIEIESWFVLDQTGKMLAIWPEAQHVMGRDFSRRDYFIHAVRQGTAEPYIGKPYHSQNNRRYKVPVSTALRHGSDASAYSGVLAASVSTPETLVMDLTNALGRQVYRWAVVVLIPMFVFVLSCFIIRLRRTLKPLPAKGS